MKVFVVLLLATLAGCQEPSIFELMRQGMAEGKLKQSLNWVLEDIILEGGYNVTVESMLSLGERHLCFNTEVVECDPTENMILGCNCVSGFLEQGECADVPCRLFRLVSGGATALRELVNANTAEEVSEWVADNIYLPLTSIVCDCPGVFGATVNCAANYDGKIFMFMENGDHAEERFRSTVGQLELGALQEVLERMVGGSCGDIDGTNCHQHLAGILVSIGAALDKSMDPEHDPAACDSLKRYETEIANYQMSYYHETDDLKKYLRGIVNGYVRMQRAMLCDAECADYISETYYGCCLKRAVEIYTEEAVKKKMTKVVKNFYTVLTGKTFPKLKGLKGAIAKYYSIFDVEKFCGPDISAYRAVNEMCEAIEA